MIMSSFCFCFLDGRLIHYDHKCNRAMYVIYSYIPPP